MTSYEIPLVGGPFAGRMVVCIGPHLLVPMPSRVVPSMISPRVPDTDFNSIQTSLYRLFRKSLHVGRYMTVEMTAYVYDNTPEKDVERAIFGMAVASCVVVASESTRVTP